jgi:hypothetical protein
MSPRKSNVIVILTFLSVGTTVAFLPTRIFPSRIIAVSTATDNALSSSKEELDRDEHVRILDENLVRQTGKSLRDYAGGDEVQTSMRYALMSHGALNDLDGPTINYANLQRSPLLKWRLSNSQPCRQVGWPIQAWMKKSGRKCFKRYDKWEKKESCKTTRGFDALSIKLRSFYGMQWYVSTWERILSINANFNSLLMQIWNCYDDEGE